MKILIATNMYPTARRPYLGIFVREQVESLRALGHLVDVAEHVAESSRWAYWHGLWDLRRRLRRNDYDLIHCHHTYSTLLALAARRLAARRPPIVMTFQEGEVLRHVAAGERPPTFRLKRIALRGADHVIAVQRDMLRATLGPEADRVPATVVPMGVDLERFKPGVRAEARQRLGWPADGLCVLFPTDPSRSLKRPDLARGGFDRWRAALPDPEQRGQARLVLGGDIDYARMPDAIRASNAVLITSDFEASPTVVKEALACERPIVSTDVGDVRERYAGLDGVRLCDWTTDSVAAALAGAVAIREPFGGRQRLLDQGLGLDQVAHRIADVYRLVVASAQSGS